MIIQNEKPKMYLTNCKTDFQIKKTIAITGYLPHLPSFAISNPNNKTKNLRNNCKDIPFQVFRNLLIHFVIP